MHEPVLAKWLRWLAYASALVPLIIFSQFMSPFHFGKVVVFRSIVEVMLVLYVLLLWQDRSYVPKSHPITWAFVAFTAAFTLTSITSVAWLQSFWGTLERMGGLWTFWHYLIFYIIIVSVLRTRRDWQILLDTMIVVGVVSAFYGFLQKTSVSWVVGSGARQRIFGTLGNPALFAGYQILVGYLALTLGLLKRTTGGWRRWYWIAALIMLFAATSTAVRGSLLGMVVATVVGLLLYNSLTRSKKGKIALLSSIGMIVIFFFLSITLRQTSLVQNSQYLQRITNFSSSTFTVKTRFWAWQAGLKGWSDSPRTVLLGWGPENFNIPFSKYFNPKFFTAPGAETFFDRAHNMFVEVLVTMGLVGLLTYLAIFWALFRTLTKFMKEPGDTRIVGIGLTALTVAYVVHNAFIFDTSANFLTFFMILAFVTHVSLRSIDASATDQRVVGGGQKMRPMTPGQVIAGIVMFLAVTVLIYKTNVRPSLANYATTRAIVAGWNGDFVTAVNKYRESIDYDTPGRYEFRQRFAQYLLEVSASTDTSKIANFNDVVSTAIQDVERNISENPRDYLPLLYLSRLHITLGKNDTHSPHNTAALEYATRALEISPTFVRTYYEIAQVYLNMKDYDTALEWFKKARDLNPDVEVSYWYLGLVQYQRGNVQEAIKYLDISLQKGHALTEPDAQKLVTIYLNIKDFKRIVIVYEQLVKNFPDNYRNWASLAAAYTQVGRIPDAVNAVRKAVELNPNDTAFRQQAEMFLRSLGATL